MKKILALGMLLASIGSVTLSAEAKTNNANNLTATNNEPQIRVQIGQPRRNRRNRVYTTTRLVRRGYATYRETYRITRYSNGRVTTQLISRVRVR